MITAQPDPPLHDIVRWLLRITRPVHPLLLVSLLCRIINLLLDLVLFGLAAGGVVHMMTGGGNPGMLAAALVAVALSKAAFYYFEQFTGHYVAFKALELLRTFVYAKIWPKAPAFVTHSRSGDVLTSLTRDVDRIEVVYAHTFAPVISAYVVGSLAILIAGILAGWKLIWVVGLCLALSLFVVPYIGARRSFNQTQATLEARRNLAHHITDTVFGVDEVIGYGRESERIAEMDQLGGEVCRSARTPRNLVAFRRGANVTLSLVATISVVWIGMGMAESPVVVAAVAAASLRLFKGPRGIEDSVGYLDHSLAAARRLWEMSNAPERVSDGPDELALEAAPTVSFQSVHYGYPGADGSALPDAIIDVSLQVPAGGHAILVGRSGSGKSTLIQLLQRHDDPRSGQVAIDGVPVDRFTLDSLRRNVVAVSQKNQLLATTLAENLRLGAPDATDDELWEALAIVGLADEVQAMPEGLDTHTGQNGSALSGGQAQRVCLARALLMHPKILVLDEFTANLNIELEDEIRKALAKWDSELTIIEITHRLRATAHADVISVLDQGRIVLSGGPADVTPEAIESLFHVRQRSIQEHSGTQATEGRSSAVRCTAARSIATGTNTFTS
ncbi:thiol reductant ABC exporter subunit CydC [Aquamicrobium segne]|uniref:Thiol reductant ABC exporter subunit CydC n=1 Tax=Aquamicrobium segne TaxID=469547 RepID=A0ABW0GW55_9HYPH